MHVSHFGGVVDQLVAADCDKVGEHQFDDWLVAHHRGANATSHDGRFRQRRVSNPLRAEFSQQALRDFETTAVVGYAFADEKYASSAESVG
jgi:hypothetical protein